MMRSCRSDRQGQHCRQGSTICSELHTQLLGQVVGSHYEARQPGGSCGGCNLLQFENGERGFDHHPELRVPGRLAQRVVVLEYVLRGAYFWHQYRVGIGVTHGFQVSATPFGI
jgi:hypothetical protein